MHAFATPRKTVFVLIDDDPAEVDLIKQAFKGAAPHVLLLPVGDASEAVKYLRGLDQYTDRVKYPLPNVILLDLKMPGFDGFAFLDWLRSSSPDAQRRLPVIIMSSSADRADVDRAYDRGVNAYIAKTVDPQVFNERLKLLGVFWSGHTETPGGQ